MVCALYGHADEQYAALVPFLKDGIEAGDRVISFVDPTEREERRNRLRHAGIDVEAARSGTVSSKFRRGTRSICPGAVSIPTAMLGLVQEAINKGRQLGFKRTRGWANMEWALRDAPGVELAGDLRKPAQPYLAPLW